ncbi:MCD, Malonyl-CoA decarboxylase MCD [Prosthecomicrobium hirschii]|uniref:MCD, Malonyl-CoA decarboxylase MCD n=2 Tax=Prosthecodimorpha hirschii TaxID=665126 RepID=A0A0P6VHR0_9HYPH|nr:MCD, Malonyl-CoA decarboxylase MCD [Prosthecomicrobium hirschii]
MMNITYMAELLATVSERASRLVGLGPKPRSTAERGDIAALAADLVSHRGEASGVAIAREILARYDALGTDEKVRFLSGLVERFGPDEERVARAVESWRADPSPVAVSELHIAAEPRRQELLRRLNLAPGGTLALVHLREDVLDLMGDEPTLKVLDIDLVHLFSSWFNRGFLVVRRIDWSTPANILEKLIEYEAVHEIDGWDDLRRRIEPADRRCYAFFHPQLADEPLIFVEIALTTGIPSAIGPLLAADRRPLAPKEATTAVFYSISNCQQGLAGISFGSFLIKQVVDELKRDLPQLTTFVTLSPAPGFAAWLDRERNAETSPLTPSDRQTLDLLDRPGWHLDKAVTDRIEPVMRNAAARYFLEARTPKGRPVDPVARFHLGNGARLEQIDVFGDTSPRGLAQAYGLMVNYLYDLDRIEENHEAYADKGATAASSAVRALLKRDATSRELV